MAYFPQSIMPSNLKNPNEDFRGNPNLISSNDFNKHDGEIVAIEKWVGVETPTIPSSGTVQNNSCSQIPTFEATGTLTSRLNEIYSRIQTIQNNMFLQISGSVCVKNDNKTEAPEIPFPSDWYTTLSVPLHDSVPVDDELDVFSGFYDRVEIADGSSLPSDGYVTIINDISPFWYYLDYAGQTPRDGYSTAFRKYMGYTEPGMPFSQFSSQGLPAWNFSSGAADNLPNILQPDGNFMIGFTVGFSGSSPNNPRYMLPKSPQRIFGETITNVEILHYSGVDTTSTPHALLNVYGQQLGTTHTRHMQGDLVFFGKMAIQAYPIMIKDSTSDGSYHCALRSNGRVDLQIRGNTVVRTEEGLDHAVKTDSTVLGYAGYHAVLIKNVAPLPVREN